MSNEVTPAERRFENERLDEISPAQPSGPDRIDADDVPEALGSAAPVHVKPDHAHRMEH